MKRWLIVVPLLALVAGVSGCAAVVVAAGASAVVVAHDRRTVGAFIDDQDIEFKARSAIDSDDDLATQVHVDVTSMNGIVLLTGEAPRVELRDRVLAKVRAIQAVREVVDDIVIAPPSSVASRLHDSWLTTEVKARLLDTPGLDSTRVKVVTEKSVVYLLGLVTRKEADLATGAARSADGVKDVVLLFEYIG